MKHNRFPKNINIIIYNIYTKHTAEDMAWRCAMWTTWHNPLTCFFLSASSLGFWPRRQRTATVLLSLSYGFRFMVHSFINQNYNRFDGFAIYNIYVWTNFKFLFGLCDVEVECRRLVVAVAAYTAMCLRPAQSGQILTHHGITVTASLIKNKQNIESTYFYDGGPMCT